MSNKTIKVLLIEDDPMVREVNKSFIESIDGFEIVGQAGDGEEGLRIASNKDIDVVILDIFMPKLDGIHTLQEFRKQKWDIDVIVVSAAKDNETINSMLQNGAIDYIIKPFKFERMKKSLENYRFYKNSLNKSKTFSQEELDAMMNVRQETRSSGTLPKGLNMFTLQQITTFMKGESVSKSAEEVATAVGIARVTARRYLDYLEKTGVIRLDVQYGSVGRPVNRYVMN
ncbi:MULTISPECIES: response regulator [Heyndrickxia]|uniref:response regulator n=1 Tax=Heyndrickxia TaxID=2837504 RepID=UPI001B1A78FA|nr:response regulator [Heyndrickxia oleronia]GIN40125.1 putative C4-dicarboxylate response regulator DctR [Heyndrickxia oleronia]